MREDTIFALASGAGKAAVAVVRISGPGARSALVAICGTAPEPRLASLRRFRDPGSGEIIDQGLALWFPAPRSPTGEDCAELHMHGGSAVIDGVLESLRRLPSLRLAEPGEFARRAFENGKLDLSQAEALADLVDAQTQFQRRQALRVTSGALRVQIEDWRRRLIQGAAILAAELDFSDEVDVLAADQGRSRLRELLTSLVEEMDAALNRSPASERLRDGYQTLVMGPPNAGKSTLLNVLAGRELAIVTPQPGTTRDLIEAQLDLQGAPVTLIDSAGLRESTDEVEQIGVVRARARAKDVDLVLWLSEGGRAPTPELGRADLEILRIATKCDLHAPVEGALGLSAIKGLGIDVLRDELAKRARARLGDGASSLLIRARHRDAIENARSHLSAVLQRQGISELAAEDIRIASRELARIVGAVDVEHVLDAVFSRFCIGK